MKNPEERRQGIARTLQKMPSEPRAIMIPFGLAREVSQGGEIGMPIWEAIDAGSRAAFDHGLNFLEHRGGISLPNWKHEQLIPYLEGEHSWALMALAHRSEIPWGMAVELIRNGHSDLMLARDKAAERTEQGDPEASLARAWAHRLKNAAANGIQASLRGEATGPQNRRASAVMIQLGLGAEPLVAELGEEWLANILLSGGEAEKLSLHAALGHGIRKGTEGWPTPDPLRSIAVLRASLAGKNVESVLQEPDAQLTGRLLEKITASGGLLIRSGADAGGLGWLLAVPGTGTPEKSPFITVWQEKDSLAAGGRK